MHNPGTIPDLRYMLSADCTVVFEESLQTFLVRDSVKTLLALTENRSQLCVVMHSIPTFKTKEQFHSLVLEVRKVAGSLFMTDLNTDYYARFSPRWTEFVQVMAA